MALIKCSNCNKNISDKAVKCPHCGTQFKKLENQNKITIVKIFVIIGLILYTLYVLINGFNVIISIFRYGNGYKPGIDDLFILFNNIIKILFFIACSIIPWLVLFLKNKCPKFLKIYSLILVMINTLLNINYLLIGNMYIYSSSGSLYTYSIIYNLINTAIVPFLIYFALVGNKENDLVVIKKDVVINSELKEKVIQENNTSNINNIYVWLVACTPILALLIFWLFSYIFSSYWVGIIFSIIFVNIQILFIVNDYKFLNNSGVDTSLLGKFNAFKIVVPKYLLKRAEILKENISYFVVWLVSFIFFVIIIIFGFNPLYLFNNHQNNNYMQQEEYSNSEQIEDENERPENAIAGLEKLNIYVTRDELRKLLNSNSSYTELYVLQRLIDEKFFEKIYSKEKKNAQKYVDDNMNSIEKYYGTGEQLLEIIRSYTGHNSIEEFKKDLLLDYYRNKAVEDYIKEQITDKEIEEYYKEREKDFTSMEISHIFIKPNTTNEMSEEDKKKEEEKAKNEIKKIIEELDGGADFSELAKKYSEDNETKNKGGNLGYLKKDDVSETLFHEATLLNVGEYSKSPVLTEYGYHIILKTKQGKKSTLEEVKDEIISILAKEEISMDVDIPTKTLNKIRSSNGLVIYDSDLESLYEQYVTGELPRGYEGDLE